MSENLANPILDEISENLTEFLDNIKCLKDSFGYSELILKSQLSKAAKAFENHQKSLSGIWFN